MSPTATQEDQIHEVDDEEMQSVGAMQSLREVKNNKIVEIQDIDSQYISQGTQGSQPVLQQVCNLAPEYGQPFENK